MLGSLLFTIGYQSFSNESLFSLTLSMMGNSGTLSSTLLASAALCLAADIFAEIVARNLRQTLPSNKFKSRRADQRAEILRYLIGSYLVFAGSIYIIFVQSAVRLTSAQPFSYTVFVVCLLLALGASLSVTLFISFPALTQTQTRYTPNIPKSKLATYFAVRIIVSVLTIVIFNWALILQGDLINAVFPQPSLSPVERIATRCYFGNDGLLHLTVMYYNHGSDWMIYGDNNISIYFWVSANGTDGDFLSSRELTATRPGMAAMGPNSPIALDWSFSSQDSENAERELTDKAPLAHCQPKPDAGWHSVKDGQLDQFSFSK
jgi:hypothetical protein